jgi:hypothetical protein
MIAAAGSARAAVTANAAVLRTCSHVQYPPRERAVIETCSLTRRSRIGWISCPPPLGASRTASRITMQGGPQMGQSSVWRLSRSPYRFWEH